jgi:hypothetical protein
LDLVAAAQIQALATNLVGSLVLATAAAARGPLAIFRVTLAVIPLGLKLAFRLFGVVVVTVILMVGVERPVLAVIILGLGAEAFFLGGMFGLFAQQRFAVRLGDLVIIWVDFAKSEKAVAVSAIVYERRLKRGFDAGYLGKVDIPLSCLCSADSKSNSSIRFPWTTATRVSSGWRASISMRVVIE